VVASGVAGEKYPWWRPASQDAPPERVSRAARLDLEWVRRNMKQSEYLYQELARRDVFDRRGPRKLGVLLSLDHRYRSLLDLPVERELSRRLFLRLLDARILLGVMRAALTLKHKRYPDDARLFELSTRLGDPATEAAAERVGGQRGDGLLSYARNTERTVLRLLVALLQTDVDERLEGHNELYSLRVLADGINIDGEPLPLQPLLMFDDGHELESTQRDILLNELRGRSTSVGRWYAERFEALSDQEILSNVGQQGRDHILVDLDEIARHGSSDGRRFQRGRYERVLTDIARRRAAPVLLTYAQEDQEFLSLLVEPGDEVLGEREAEILGKLQGRTKERAGDDPRYEVWFKEASQLGGWPAAVRWQELEVLITRDKNRQQDLFDEPLSEEEVEQRSSPALREGAALSVAKEFGLPYYGGASAAVRLASHNAEQFLNLCGDLFAEMLVDVSIGRQPRLISGDSTE
jgi:hypothetical protein